MTTRDWRAELTELMDSPLLPLALHELLDHLPGASAELSAFVNETRGFPRSWGPWQIELAWAFEGLLGRRVGGAGPSSEFFVYFEEPYVAEGASTVREAFEAAKLPASFGREQPYELATSGHYLIVRGDSKLPKAPTRELWRVGVPVSLGDSTRLMVPVERALPLVGEARPHEFRFLLRAQTDGSLFEALRAAFELPEQPGPLYARDALRQVFTTEGELVARAVAWLDEWVHSPALRTHLSCFLERRRGLRDRRDLFLAFHTNPGWGCACPPGLWLPLLDQLGATFLLGWEWEHVDLLSARAVVQLANNPG